MSTKKTAADREEELAELGFVKRYRLVGHPAYPDPLVIHPPTKERATEVYQRYCTDTFDEYIALLGHIPHSPFRKVTAETFNPRILVDWVYEGDRVEFVPVP